MICVGTPARGMCAASRSEAETRTSSPSAITEASPRSTPSTISGIGAGAGTWGAAGAGLGGAGLGVASGGGCAFGFGGAGVLTFFFGSGFAGEISSGSIFIRLGGGASSIGSTCICLGGAPASVCAGARPAASRQTMTAPRRRSGPARTGTHFGGPADGARIQDDFHLDGLHPPAIVGHAHVVGQPAVRENVPVVQFLLRNLLS